MARFPAFSTSVAAHAAALTVLVVLPAFAPEPLPVPGAGPLPLPDWPLHPKVVFAASRPAPTPARAAGPPLAPRPAAPTPFAAEQAPPPAAVPESLPTDDSPGGGFGDPVAAAATGDGEPGACCGVMANGSGTGGEGPSAGGTLRVGGQVLPPTKLRHVAPRYPELAARARISGTVEIDCLIDEEGQVRDLRVLNGHPLLAPAAVEAVRAWRYSPTRLNGRAVPVLLTVTVRFERGR